jgi:putative hydrolase
MRQIQGTMSVIEGYSNLVMNELGGRLLPEFQRLEKAYRERSSGKSALDVLIWKLTGLDLKLQQYKRGEAFCRAVFDQHGIKVLNEVWKGPDKMPRLDELGAADRWYRRVITAAA